MENIKKVYFIFREILSAIFKRDSSFSLIKNIQNLSRWWKSFNANRNSLSDASPWLSFEAIDYLSEYLHSDMKVFEYGSGGSTIFFAKRVSSIVSIEHNELWYKKVKECFKNERINNVDYFNILPEKDDSQNLKDISNASHYISEDRNYIGFNFQSYVKKIDDFENEYFDCIVIDGRARPSCLKHSVSKVKRGGIIVYDNCESKHYDEAIAQYLQDFELRTYTGFFPYLDHFSTTLIARRIK